MLMTEAEAREKWCPWARTLDGSVGNGENIQGYAASVNRGLPAANMECLRCIASACSQWVEIHASVHDIGPYEEHTPAKGVMACNPVGAAHAIQHFQLAPYPNPNGFLEAT